MTDDLARRARGSWWLRAVQAVACWRPVEGHDIRAHIIAPIWLRIPARTRWRVVGVLNKSRRYAWCDLVDAALAYHEDDPCDVRTLPAPQETPPCAVNCGWFSRDHTGEHDCSCYCGKFRFRAESGWEDRQ